MIITVDKAGPTRLNDHTLEELDTSAIRLADLPNNQTDSELPTQIPHLADLEDNQTESESIEPISHIQFSPPPQFLRDVRYPWSSSSSSPEIRPLGAVGRAKTFSRFSTEVKVLVRTLFRDLEGSDIITLPRDATIPETYRLIGSATKRFAEENCGGLSCEDELSLLEGSCTITCSGGGGCRKVNPEQDTTSSEEVEPLSLTPRRPCLRYQVPLLNEQDWAEIETLVANYENGDERHKHIEIEITRKLELTKKPVAMTPKGSIRDYLWGEIERALKRPGAAKALYYIPKDQLERLTTREIVVPLLENEPTDTAVALEERSKLAEKIYHEAPILLAIFVYGRVPLGLLEEMVAHDINDSKLPLPEKIPSWIYEESSQWQSYRVLIRQQWSFTAAVFHHIGDHQKFAPDIIIPFLIKEEKARGAFSIVYRVQIEQSHQRLYALKDVRILETILAPFLKRLSTSTKPVS